MAIWHAAPRTLLSVFLESTDEQFYFTELVTKSSLDRTSVSRILQVLTITGILQKHTQEHNPAGAPRVYYSLTPKGVSAIRMSV